MVVGEVDCTTDVVGAVVGCEVYPCTPAADEPPDPCTGCVRGTVVVDEDEDDCSIWKLASGKKLQRAARLQCLRLL